MRDTVGVFGRLLLLLNFQKILPLGTLDTIWNGGALGNHSCASSSDKMPGCPPSPALKQLLRSWLCPALTASQVSSHQAAPISQAGGQEHLKAKSNLL